MAAERARKSILIVEDEMLIALTVKNQLEKYNYSATIISSGEKAIQAVKNDSRYDLILMDINLGRGMDGTEAAKLILTIRDLPIIFHSSHIESEIVKKTEKITSYGYVVKNTGITVLDASIKMAFKLFDAKKAEQEKDLALKINKARWQALAENSPDFIMLLNENFEIIFINRAIEGLEKENVIGTSILDFTPEIKDKVKSILQDVLDNHMERTYSVTYKNPDGKPFTLINRVSIITTDFDEADLLITASDITMLKHEEIVAIQDSIKKTIT